MTSKRICSNRSAPSSRETKVSAQTIEEVLPALFGHCVAVYAAMEKSARRAGGMVVYEGMLTRLMAGPPLMLSTPYYTKIRRELLRMGCIRQLKRGGGNSASQWELCTPPTEELYNTG